MKKQAGKQQATARFDDPSMPVSRGQTWCANVMADPGFTDNESRYADRFDFRR